jgi:tripartite-type tricarboxylate transporter receptor subunit TctC
MLRRMARSISFMPALLAFSAWLAVSAAVPARAEAPGDHPNKLIRVIVPVAPGGLADTLARAVSQHLQAAFNQQVIVESKPGGNFQIAVNHVMSSPADGYTLLILQDGAVALNPHLYSKLSYEVKDLMPISGIAKVDQVLITHPSFPAKTTQELIALVKSKPGEFNFGTFGSGSSPHMYMEMLNRMAGLKFTPVQYRGAAPMLADVVANHVPMTFISLGQGLPLAREGKLNILAVGTSERLAVLPDVPTLMESLPGFEATTWFGLFATKGTPPAIIDKISAEVRRMANDPDFKARVLEPTYFRSMAGTPAEFAETITTESARWKKFVEEAKLRIE